MRCVIEAYRVCNGINLHLGVPQEMFRDFDSYPRDELSRRHAEIRAKLTGQMARRYADRRRDTRHRQRADEVVAEVVERATRDRVEARLGGERLLNDAGSRQMVHEHAELKWFRHDRVDCDRRELTA